VAVGAWSEWPRRWHWPSGLTLSSVMRTARLIAPPGRGPLHPDRGEALLLTATDGRPVGLITPPAALTADTPRAASSPSVIPLEPEMIVLPGESRGAAVERMVALSLPYIAVAGADGRIEGVIMRADVER